MAAVGQYVGRVVAWSALAGTLVVLLAVPRTNDRLTTFATAAPRLAQADLVATLVLIGACLVGLVLQPTRPGTWAVGLAALVWTFPNWTGWLDGPHLVRSIGLALSAFMVPLLVHIALAAAGRDRRHRNALLALYALAAAVALARGLWYRPYVDVACFESCYARNVFLVDDRLDLVRRVGSAGLLGTAAAGVGLGVASARWLMAATPAGRRMRGPAFVAGVVLGGVLLTQSAVRWSRPRVDPTTALDARLYLALVGAVVLVAAAWAYGPVLDLWTRRELSRLVTGLGSAAEAGTVARVLASATGDPGIRLVYSLPSSGGYADATGRTLEPPPPGPGVTPLLRDDQVLAVVLHDADATDSERVRAACGPALLLALDNERLRAEGLAQLADLRASRARVVATGDAERRQLERNLHDGAQQRLLALSFDLRRAVTGATGTPSQRNGLGSAEQDARLALAELRELAHGIHPAVLEEAGLGAALSTLADTAGLPVELREVPRVRLPMGVERTAYVVVRDAVTAAASAGSEHVTVSVMVVDDDVVVEVTGLPQEPVVTIEDRVAGVGGHVEMGDCLLRAVIPCAS
jgi:signal transduction histidine kinase